jgi:large subunit ribosomal protein L6
MSRIGKRVIKVPDGVTVTVEGARVKIKGPKGEIERDFHPSTQVIHENGELRVDRASDRRDHRALHGLAGSLLMNMVKGVTEGFERKLEIVGVGYRAEVAGKGLRKEKVGQAAAEIRGFRPPEPYKGKGIRYHGEQVRRKAGKTAI